MDEIHFENNPITEALVDIYFEGEKDWDSTYLGLLWEKIKSKYPEKKEVAELQVHIRHNEGANELQQRISSPISRLQYWNKGRDKAVQLGKNHLTVNQLKPYPGWKYFRKDILYAFKQYLETIKGQKAKVVGIALRYINTWMFKKQVIQLEEYFNVHPNFNSSTFEDYSSMAIRLGTNKDANTNYTLGFNGSIENQQIKIVLDINNVVSNQALTTVKQFESVLEKMHKNSQGIFLESITETNKELIS